MHSTNYYDVLIEVSADSSAETGIEPPLKKTTKTIARITYELLLSKPYSMTSDDVFFELHLIRNDVKPKDQSLEREHFFSKGQPCFRASPLPKIYGWGIHSDHEGKVALCAVDSTEYKQFIQDPNVTKRKAMRSKRQ